MSKKKKNKNNKKNKNAVIVEKHYQNNNKNQIENDINKILDELTVEEITELEEIGDFSKEALEWLRAKKRKKKTKKAQEEFERRLRASDEVIRRTVLIGKIEGFKNGQYKPKNKTEEAEIVQEIEADIERDERIKERVLGDERSSKSGGKTKGERDR